MTVPDELVGTWVRTSISLDGAPPDEWEDVVWVQTRSHFADLRLPRAGTVAPANAPRSPWAFSGTTESEPGRLRWIHSVDSHRPGSPDPHAGDEGDVRWQDDDPGSGILIETGSFGATRYEEVWQRVEASAHGDPLVLEAPDGAGRLVRVGDHSVVVAEHSSTGDVAARHDRWDGRSWVPVGHLGSADHLPDPEHHGGWNALDPFGPHEDRPIG